LEAVGMNIMDRSFSAQVDAAKAERAARRRKIALGVAAILVVVVAAAIYVWAMTLCGDCSAPLSPPP
jgi:type VI protein secretion system component VasF